MLVRLTFLIVFVISCNQSGFDNIKKDPAELAGKLKNAPDFSLLSIKAKPKSLKDYKGKILLINFWATWCPPCVAELPALSRVAEKYQDRGLKVITINTDPESLRTKVVELYNKKNFKFDILYDPELEIANKYGVEGFPETFFVNKDGKLVKFYDAKEKKKVEKVISDREWYSKKFQKSFEELLKKWS